MKKGLKTKNKISLQNSSINWWADIDEVKSTEKADSAIISQVSKGGHTLVTAKCQNLAYKNLVEQLVCKSHNSIQL